MYMEKTNTPLKMNLSFFSEGEPPKEEETAIDEKPKEELPKTFTQADLDRLVGKTKLELKAKIPDAERLKAFSEWEKSQQTETEKAIEKDKAFSLMEKDFKTMLLENKLLKEKIPANLIKYAMLDMAEHEDVNEGIKAFKESDLYQAFMKKETPPRFGADGKPEVTSTEADNLKAEYETAIKQKQTAKVAALIRQASEKNIKLF